MINWVAGFLDNELFLQEMWGKMGLSESRQRDGWNYLPSGLKAGQREQEWLKHLLNHESCPQLPSLSETAPQPLRGHEEQTEKADLWVRWKEGGRILELDIKGGVKSPFLLAFNSIVLRMLRIRNFFQLPTPAALSVQSQLESQRVWSTRNIYFVEQTNKKSRRKDQSFFKSMSSMDTYLSHSSISRNRCCPQGTGGREGDEKIVTFSLEVIS